MRAPDLGLAWISRLVDCCLPGKRLGVAGLRLGALVLASAAVVAGAAGVVSPRITER